MKKKFQIFSLVERQVINSLEFVKESRKFIYFVILVFVFSSLIGFFVPMPSEIQAQILKYFENLVGQISNLSFVELVVFLFENNSFVSFLGLFLGVFFGLFPALNTILNGVFLGFAASISVAEGGLFSLWRLIPHGIFELPAIFISLGLGLKISTFILKKEKGKFLKEYLHKSVCVYVFIILPLLVLAAIIEGLFIFSS